jgi:hypothetical protein
LKLHEDEACVPQDTHHKRVTGSHLFIHSNSKCEEYKSLTKTCRQLHP